MPRDFENPAALRTQWFFCFLRENGKNGIFGEIPAGRHTERESPRDVWKD